MERGDTYPWTMERNRERKKERKKGRNTQRKQERMKEGGKRKKENEARCWYVQHGEH
jgi:hypothetical protein